MKSLIKHKLTILFLLLIFMFPLLTAMRHNINISHIENRTLASLPSYSKENLLSGEYFKGWDDYISDHIFGRDYLIKSYTLLNMEILKKHKINNIVIGKENTLLPYYTEDLSKTLEDNINNLPIMINNINNLNHFVNDYGGNFLFVGLPGQSSFFRDRYPSYFSNKNDYFIDNETLMFNELDESKVNYVNMNRVFIDDFDKDYYLKTDHHFSFKGSFKTYEEILKKIRNDFNLNIQSSLSLNDLDLVTIDNPILGSRNRQVYFLKETDELITVAYPKNKIDYKKYVNSVEDPKLYYLDEDKNERPSYGIYMGGDHAEVIIDTNRDELPNLLIFGDSFTNALEPLLYYHFNETRILDLRHYNDITLYDYIELHKPDVVLMIRDDMNYGNLQGNGQFK